MADITELKKHTKNFFDLHWNKNSSNDYPEWSELWYFNGPVPNNESKGCYAWLLANGQVVYIGLALNKGQSGYEGHSLGNRISKYWSLNQVTDGSTPKRKYKPSKQIEMHDIDSIVTLAFPPGDQEYLSASFEIYLIKEMKPNLNKLHK